MLTLKRLRRLESVFASLYRSEQLRLGELRQLKLNLIEQQEEILSALSSDNPAMLAMTGELLSKSARIQGQLVLLERELSSALQSAAPRKAQLGRVQRQIAEARSDEFRDAEKSNLDELLSAALPEIDR